MNGCKVAMAEHSSRKRAGVAGSAMLSQLKLNHFHHLHSLYLSQKQDSLEGSQPLRAESLKGTKMIHAMTLRETVRNKTSQEKKKERDQQRGIKVIHQIYLLLIFHLVLFLGNI